MKAALVLAALLAGALPTPLDSQLVLERYATALAELVPPKAMIFVYSISQAGPTNIEQRHRVYRSGIDVRDETIAINGISVRRKIVRIARRGDVYSVAAVAPRPDAYELLFLDAVRDGSHLDYVFQAIPLLHSSSGFAVDRVTIDGQSYLPRFVDFHSSGAIAAGSGRIAFGWQGGYWVPLSAAVSATVDGSMARERIVFSQYRFPAALPRSTFL